MALSIPSLGPRTLLLVDFPKAFDLVDWAYLFALLGKINFGPRFIAYTKLLYMQLMAQVRVGSTTSEPFPELRGTHQGCALFLFLFALSVEPLACAIRQAPDISGISFGVRQHKSPFTPIMFF